MNLSGRRRGQGPRLAIFMALLVFGAAVSSSVRAEGAEGAGVSGDAYGHYTKVGLFGGPPGVVGPAPGVTLPPGGSERPLEAAEPDGASAVFGPAKIFGGKSSLEPGEAPASGPISVSTKGTPGPGGSVTSTASITLHPEAATCEGGAPATKNCTSPGGFGPVIPNEGDELHATCTANAQGATGSARFVNAILTTSTDRGGEPKDREAIPEFPPPNYTRTGEITNLGEKFRIVYNEQIVDPDGSITVNALHMYLLGPVAVGEQILGHVRCSMKPAETSATTALPIPTTTSTSTPVGSIPPATEVRLTKTTEKGTDLLPFAVGGGLLAAALASAGLWARRRRRKDVAP